jgi:hypothetical protein
LDLETHQGSNCGARSKQRGEAGFPSGQLDIRITNQVQISYHGSDLR